MVKNKTENAEDPKDLTEEAEKAEDDVKEPETTEPEAIADPQDEVGKPQYINNGKDVKINLGDRNESNWITVKAGEVVTIPRKIALANKLEEVE